ncbi:MAG: ATP-binding protein [Alphaproteobacteria bacterium]
MKLVPQSLAGRTISVLLAGLVISNLVGLLIFAGERDTALTNIAGTKVAERIAGVVRTMEQTQRARRAAAVCAQSGPRFAVTLAPVATLGAAVSGNAHPVASTIAGLLDGPAAARLRVASQGPGTANRQPFIDVIERCGGSADWMSAMPAMMGRGMNMHDGAPMSAPMQRMMQAWRSGNVLQVSYRLDDAQWLNFMTPAPQFVSIWRSRFLLAFFVMALVVTALSVWAVRRSTAPLALFAWAAERLGRDVNAPDLPEDGPREVSRAARAFNEMQRRLRHLISDRTQMLAAISHDLRTPITRLRLRAEFVKDTEQRAKMLRDLEEMEAMISATLAFARSDATDEPRLTLDLAVLVQNVCDDAVDGGQNVTCVGPAHASHSGRPLALKRALTNLVDNAVAYGGVARVELKSASEQFTITVEDDGPGIEQGEIARVFDPFYRLEASRNRETGGTGLGLAIVRSIVRGHGGEVTLANRAEGGLTATLSLPR